MIEAGRNTSRELPAAAEELAQEVTLLGTYDQAGQAVAAWFAAGADRLQLVLPPGRPEDELAEIVAVAARVASANGSGLRLAPTEPKLV